jgi:hypothetical protein
VGNTTVEEAAESLVQFAPITTEVGGILYLADSEIRRGCIDELISLSIRTSVIGHHYAILWDTMSTMDTITLSDDIVTFADIDEAASTGLAHLAVTIDLIDNAIVTYVHNNLFGDIDVQS